MTETSFPPYPAIEDLPAGMTDKERHEFAFRLLGEHGEAVGDYLFAAVRKACTSFTPDTPGLIDRWSAMGELVEQIYGSPITLSYRACDRIKAEGRKGS